MASGRILHSGNLIRGVFVGDEDTFRKRFYDSKRTMEIGTTFIRDDGAIFVVLNDNIVKISDGFQEIPKELLILPKEPEKTGDRKRLEEICNNEIENSVKTIKEGQEIFDLKPLTEEEIAWLEEHFMDFAREQYLVRQDDIREALKKVVRHQKKNRGND